MTVSELEDAFDKPSHVQNNRQIYESVRWVKDNTTLAINALEAVSYLIKSSHSEQTIRRLFDVSINLPYTVYNFRTQLIVFSLLLEPGILRSNTHARYPRILGADPSPLHNAHDRPGSFLTLYADFVQCCRIAERDTLLDTVKWIPGQCHRIGRLLHQTGRVHL